MQEEVREKLFRYMDENGIKLKFISEKVGIPDYVLSRFRHCTQNLNVESLSKLDEYLRSKGA